MSSTGHAGYAHATTQMFSDAKRSRLGGPEGTTADAVATIAPAIASGWRASALILVTNARYFRLCM